MQEPNCCFNTIKSLRRASNLTDVEDSLVNEFVLRDGYTNIGGAGQDDTGT